MVSISGKQDDMYDKSSSQQKSEDDGVKNIDLDIGEIETPNEFIETKELRRGLHQRHIQMIALAGTIGTGLFLSSGNAIANAGPVGAFLGYSLIGFFVAGVVLSIGEMSALVPLSGGINRHAEYFFDPSLSFANGWNQVYSCIVSIPAEIVAAAIIVEFWKTVNNAIWITVFGVLMIASNVFFVRVYGELEFTFSMLKIMLIIGINIMALVIVCGGSPDHHAYGFQYWRNPGPFVQYLGYSGNLGRFMGFWTTLTNAVYSYSGIEDFSIAASEVRDPRRAIPQAARRIFVRVMLFYVLSIFMIGLLVPSNDPDLLSSTGTAASSPFVLAAKRAGIRVVPSIINFVVLTSAWSSGNSTMLAGSRLLYGIAREGHAPKIFLSTNRFGIPYVAITLYSVFIALGFMTLSSSASTVFNWLQDLVSVSTIVNWLTICAVYLRFYYGCKKQGISRSELPWKAPFQPYTAWISLVAFTILLLTGGYTTFIHRQWDNETFVSSYINIPIFFIAYFGYKFYKKTKLVSLEDMPIRHFLDIAASETKQPVTPIVGWRRFNILWS